MQIMKDISKEQFLMKFLKNEYKTFSKSPLRLSLFGGGTDIPYVYKTIGRGLTITAALDLYVTVGCSSLPFFKESN